MPSRRIRELLWWTGHFENDLVNWSGWRSAVAFLAVMPARAMLCLALALYSLAERIAPCRASDGD